jgi:lipoprotein signal peptidase
VARTAQGVALAVVAATVIDDVLQRSVLSHERSPALYAGAALLAAALLLLAPRVGSLAVTLGAGLAAGGAVATIVCGLAWHGGVPNPLLAGEIAFNIADIAIGAGVALLIGGALLQTWLQRDRLFEPL